MATEQDWATYADQTYLATTDTLLARTSIGGGVEIAGSHVVARRAASGKFYAEDDLVLASVAPALIIHETDGTTTHNAFQITKTGDNVYFQTRSNALAAVSDDYVMTVGASGVTQHAWNITGTTKAVVNTNGILVGKTTAGSYNTVGVEVNTVGLVAATRSANICGLFNRTGTDGSVVSIRNDNTEVGTISVSGTTTAYNTTSDYRLKNISGPLIDSGKFIDALNPVRGTWKTDGKTFIGFIAHEIQEVAETPIAHGEKDGEEMQGMSYASPELIAHMVAELKSLRSRVAELEAAQ